MHCAKNFPFWASLVTITTYLVPTVYAHYAITGVKTGVDDSTGARPPRRNILDLQKDLPTWSLYIQALIAMQQTPEDDLLSWFQVAGIHGRPFYSWDVYPQHPDAPLIGYCTHRNQLFPTWHRPYMALLEQILAGHVQTVAKEYNSPSYQEAADNFRIPYWDFSSIPTMPSFVNTELVTINTPTGQKDVANPLLTYVFQEFPLNPVWFPNDSDSSTDNQLSQRPKVLRFPNQDGISQPDSINSNLNGVQFMKNTYRVFTKALDFYTMATTEGSGSSGPSFEAVHNSAHYNIGGRLGGGHMFSFSFSAFDPIFWLVHANVDRLFAMWQAIYPDVYMVPHIDDEGTFTIPVGSTSDELTPLTPFTSGDGETTYTSKSSRYLSDFGYSYPEIKDWAFNSPTELAANVTAQLNALYNPGGINTRKLRRSSSGQNRARRSGLGPDQIREWTVTAKVPVLAIEEPFVVSVFLGPLPADPVEWDTASNVVGVMPVARFSGRGSIGNEFSIDDHLLKLEVDIEDVNATVTYLKEHLQWGIQKTTDHTVIRNENVPGLEISVNDDIVVLPTVNTELPKYVKKTLHPEITRGRADGAQ